MSVLEVLGHRLEVMRGARQLQKDGDDLDLSHVSASQIDDWPTTKVTQRSLRVHKALFDESRER